MYYGSNLGLTLTSKIRSLGMNLIFRDMDSKYIPIYALIAKLGTNIGNLTFSMN